MDWRHVGQWSWKVEIKPNDCWVGVFWRREQSVGFVRETLDVWICVVPMAPIHLLREYGHERG